MTEKESTEKKIRSIRRQTRHFLEHQPDNCGNSRRSKRVPVSYRLSTAEFGKAARKVHGLIF